MKQSKIQSKTWNLANSLWILVANLGFARNGGHGDLMDLGKVYMESHKTSWNTNISCKSIWVIQVHSKSWWVCNSAESNIQLAMGEHMIWWVNVHRLQCLSLWLISWTFPKGMSSVKQGMLRCLPTFAQNLWIISVCWSCWGGIDNQCRGDHLCAWKGNCLCMWKGNCLCTWKDNHLCTWKGDCLCWSWGANQWLLQRGSTVNFQVKRWLPLCMKRWSPLCIKRWLPLLILQWVIDNCCREDQHSTFVWKGDWLCMWTGNCLCTWKGNCLCTWKGDGLCAWKGDCLYMWKGDGLCWSWGGPLMIAAERINMKRWSPLCVKGNCYCVWKCNCLCAWKDNHLCIWKGNHLCMWKADCLFASEVQKVITFSHAEVINDQHREDPQRSTLWVYHDALWVILCPVPLNLR